MNTRLWTPTSSFTDEFIAPFSSPICCCLSVSLRFDPINTTPPACRYSAAFVQSVDTLANVDPDKQNDYYVARLSVRDLQNLGLTVVADPDPNGPAKHALIPELNWTAYLANKEHWKSIPTALANLAGTAVVHQPS